MGTLEDWYRISQELKTLKQIELDMRRELFMEYFADPVEGTNVVDIDGGWQLVGGYPFTRTIDPAALDAVIEQLGNTLDNVVVFKPSLSVTGYRKLDDDARLILDQALVIKPGTPTLTIRKKGK